MSDALRPHDRALERLTRLHPKKIDLSLGRIARLCAALLGRDATSAPPGTAWLIPHEPSPGGDAAAALFAAQYAAAEALYRDAFGAPPPPEVWTPATHRFAPSQQLCCITRGERAALRVMKASLEERMHAVSAGEEEDDEDDYGGCG